MNVVGFLKFHNSDIECSKDLEDLISDSVTIEEIELEQIVSYLNQGIHLFRFISDIYDAEGKTIGPFIYMTDGEWIWPSYYAYYLQKYPNMKMPEELRIHIQKKEQVRVLSDEERLYVHYILHKLLKIWIPKNNNNKVKKIQGLIESSGDQFFCC
jgi:hypothetical protein